MKRFSKKLPVLLILLSVVTQHAASLRVPMVYAQVQAGVQVSGGARPSTTTTASTPGNPNDTVSQVVTDKANQIIDKTVFNNLSALAGPACSLYGLGIDVVNFFYDGQWSFQDSLLEITALFKNNSWRELIWAINDQREAFVKDLTSLNKQQCVLGFSLPQSNANDPAKSQQTNQQIDQLERKITELKAKNDYFGLQRRNMLWDRPQFPDPAGFDPTRYVFPILETDKIFYPLFSLDNLQVNWDEATRDAKEFAKTAMEDTSVAIDKLPDTCFAVVNIGQELLLYTVYALHPINGKFVDNDGKEYKDFRDFVEHNQAAIAKSYDDAFCKKSTASTFANTSPPTGAEEQFQKFQKALKAIVDTTSKALKELEKQLKVFDDKRASGSVLTPDEENQVKSMELQAGRYQGMVEFYTLVLNKVGSSGEKSLAELGKRLNSLVEAVLGVTRDQDGKTSSRLSLSEQFAKRKEKNLQDICARIESMYRQSGRDTGDLPIIGSANGNTYCRAKPDCADVNLANVAGGSEGLKKLAECSGFLFDGSQLGPSQSTKDVFQAVGEDIGFLLEQRSYNDLLKAQKLHFVSLRSKYQELYKAQGDTTAMLENILTDTSKDLYNPEVPAVFNPNSTMEKTHYSVLRKVYQDFWKFMDQQEGSCSAPEHPED